MNVSCLNESALCTRTVYVYVPPQCHSSLQQRPGRQLSRTSLRFVVNFFKRVAGTSRGHLTPHAPEGHLFVDGRDGDGVRRGGDPQRHHREHGPDPNPREGRAGYAEAQRGRHRRAQGDRARDRPPRATARGLPRRPPRRADMPARPPREEQQHGVAAEARGGRRRARERRRGGRGGARVHDPAGHLATAKFRNRHARAGSRGRGRPGPGGPAPRDRGREPRSASAPSHARAASARGVDRVGGQRARGALRQGRRSRGAGAAADGGGAGE